MVDPFEGRVMFRFEGLDRVFFVMGGTFLKGVAGL
jgi:hypothetical protein